MLVEVIKGPYKGLKGKVIAEGVKCLLIELDGPRVYIVPRENTRRYIK